MPDRKGLILRAFLTRISYFRLHEQKIRRQYYRQRTRRETLFALSSLKELRYSDTIGDGKMSSQA